MEGFLLSKKLKNPIVIAILISFFVIIASVVIWIGVCWWDVWVGLVLLYTLLPAAGVFTCISIIIGVIIDSRKKKGEEIISEQIVYYSEEQQKYKYCPNCGTPYTFDQKQCSNCAYEL